MLRRDVKHNEAPRTYNTAGLYDLTQLGTHVVGALIMSTRNSRSTTFNIHRRTTDIYEKSKTCYLHKMITQS